jgi:hypothetical protein
MRSGGSPFGPGRVLRLDPSVLPVRFTASDAVADGQVRDIELHRERVVLRRSLRGMQMAINMPVSAFAGVALKVMLSNEWTAETTAAVLLAHKDTSLALPLLVTPQVDDALVEWRRWSRTLGLPLLVDDETGLREPFPRMGQMRIARPRPRRRRRSPLKNRRPANCLRRTFIKLSISTSVLW